MKTFKLKYSLIFHLLTYLAIAVCAAALALNIWRFVDNGGVSDFYSALSYIIIALVSVFAPILLVCVVYNSRYIVKDNELITAFGFIKSRFPIAEMSELIYDAKTKKLTIYTGESYMLFRVEESWRAELIEELRKRKNDLIYNEAEDENRKKNETPDDKDEKKK